ncbi:DUF4856 domain-containing protein [Roseivirga sp. BDSF3-8]|uniref:DUF4856 domain-containing protein n=1 Tax=Roseivirga sp. BDSF3-8 TaxID=3241598 RepID=UPI003531FF74
MRKPLYTLLVFGALFASCSEDDDSPMVNELEVPQTYTFQSFNASGSSGEAITDDLAELAGYMKTGRPGDAGDPDRNQTLNSQSLLEIYTNNGNTPSLSAVTTSEYDALVRDWFSEIAAASGNTYGEGAEGGTYGGYLVDENAVELEQFIEKGLYGAALYNQAVTVHLNTNNTTEGLGATETSVLEQNWDNAFLLYGADASFPNNGNDSWAAKYAARRDNAGFYTNLKTAFLTGRAAITAGEEFTDERNRAVVDIRENWEKALAATAINYLYSAKNGLLNATDDAGTASAYHAWAEAYAFMYGFRGVDSDFRIISDVEVNNVLGYLKSSPALFTQDNIGDIDSAIDAIAQVYNFQDPTIFEINDVSANNR